MFFMATNQKRSNHSLYSDAVALKKIVEHDFLLVAETVLLAAVRALPGDAVAGHAPHVFVHARLTDSEAAPAGPAERGYFPAAMAGFIPGSAFFTAISYFPGSV